MENPDFQYAKLSFIRLSAFGSIYSNISNPTWLPELDQTIRIFFKLGPWISLTTFPLGIVNYNFYWSIYHSKPRYFLIPLYRFIQVSDAYCNVIYRLWVYSHVMSCIIIIISLFSKAIYQLSSMFPVYQKRIMLFHIKESSIRFSDI
jgi:hypothetical protein